MLASRRCDNALGLTAPAFRPVRRCDQI